MPRVAVSEKRVATELARCLEDNEFEEFRINLGAAEEIGYNLNTQYGKEVGYKTILQLAIEEDDHDTTDFIRALLEDGASARYVNTALQSSPIHAAAEQINFSALSLLLQYPQNKANVNAENKYGLTGLHILLAKLMDLAYLQSKTMDQRPNKASDEEVETDLSDCLDCISLICKQKELSIDFDSGIKLDMDKLGKNKHSYKKLSAMTPLQMLCSFQSWNAKPIPLKLHKKLSEVVDILLGRGVDPNSVGAKGAVAGSVAGSTPPVLLAATRGYHLVLSVFKNSRETNFLVENKFKQNILHIILKAGYYNKILVHGDEFSASSEQSIFTLFQDNNNYVKYVMKSIINREDSYGNTPLFYAKHYPNQEITKFLLRNGAKLHLSNDVVNINPKALEEFFLEDCIEIHGDDVDDEDFTIRINYDIFAYPEVDPDLKLEKVDKTAQAWSVEVERMEKGLPVDNEVNTKRDRVDTRRLEIFSDVPSFRYLLKHPVLSSFLELEIYNLKRGYILDFVLYLIFVLVLFLFLHERFLKNEFKMTFEVFYEKNMDYSITISTILIIIMLVLLIIREIVQIIKIKKRYFHYYENYLEWSVIALVIVALLPDKLMGVSAHDMNIVQRHLAAFTYLFAFTQLYLLVARMLPNTPIPLYINMYLRVLKTYTFILLSYFAFILSFAFSFTLIYSGDPNESDSSTTKSNETSATAPAADGPVCCVNDELYGNVGVSLVTALVMFSGEMSYSDITITHWMGYLLLALFIFLIVIVLMNLLNGMAVSDIQRIRNEEETYYHTSIVETLIYKKWVKLLASHIILQPNIRPENQTLFGIDIPGEKIYPILGNGKKKFYLGETVVKAAKELATSRQAASDDNGQKVSLEDIDETLDSMKREQVGIKTRLATIEDNLALILDIMQSRAPPVNR